MHYTQQMCDIIYDIRIPYHVFVSGSFFSSTMAQAAETIIEGLGDNPLNDDQAGDFLKWIGDLAGDSFEDNDESFKDVCVDFLLQVSTFASEIHYDLYFTFAYASTRVSNSVVHAITR